MAVRFTRRGVLTAAACASLAGAAGCAWFRPSYDWNYRLTLVVDTPSGERRASSVYHAVAKPVEYIKRSGYAMTGYGEAVALYLPDAHGGKGAWLFAERLAHWESAALPATAYRETLREMGAKWVHINPVSDYDWLALMDDLKGLPPAVFEPPVHYDWRASTKRADYVPRIRKKEVPRLLTFGDVEDPLSVREVEPDELAAVFGPGHRFRAMLVEIVDDEPQYGRAESILPWLAKGGGTFTNIHKLRRPGTRPGKFRTAHPNFDFLASVGTSNFVLRPDQ